jgi:hypothetical protein
MCPQKPKELVMDTPSTGTTSMDTPSTGTTGTGERGTGPHSTGTQRPEAAGPDLRRLDHPRSLLAFRRVKLLAGCYLGLSVLTLGAIIALRHHPAAVNSAVWTRGSIVAASAVLMIVLVARAARGASRAYLRLRIISVILVAAVAVIVALPGIFPLWMKLEQGACGLVLIGVAALVNGRHLRAVFAGR